MKPAQIKLFLKAVKTMCFIFIVGCFCSFLLALKTKKLAEDLWKQLGITQSIADINIRVSVTGNSLQYAGAKNSKNILISNRPAIVNELVAYAKKYTASTEFKKEYANIRRNAKPKEPMLFTINVDSIRNSERKRILQDIKLTEGNANHPNSKIKNAVPYRLEALKKELAAVDDPNNKRVQSEVKQLESYNKAHKDAYQKEQDQYISRYPENPQTLIKKRLQDILDITADVDYNAEVKQGPKFKYFVNPEYEKKSKEWKLAYRAGKAATDAVRAAAEKWIADISKQEATGNKQL